MARRREMTLARERLTHDPSNQSLLCVLSGRFIMSAVRDVNTGDLYDEKVAKLNGKDVVPDVESTTRAQDLLHAHMEAVELDEGLESWKTQFPKPTDDLLFYSRSATIA